MRAIHGAFARCLLLSLLAALALGGCGGSAGGLPNISVGLVDTATPRPTLTPISAQERQATATSLAALVLQPAGQLSATPDESPLPPAAASATRRAGGGGGPAPTATPTPTPTLDVRQLGIEASFSLEAQRTRYRRNEPIWVNFTITNVNGTPLPYGFIGITLPDNSFHTSLSGLVLAPFEVKPWRDWVSLASPGSYRLRLSMCFSSRDECRNGGHWTEVAPPLSVIIE
jgi:hypothetical protein